MTELYPNINLINLNISGQLWPTNKGDPHIEGVLVLETSKGTNIT